MFCLKCLFLMHGFLFLSCSYSFVLLFLLLTAQLIEMTRSKPARFITER